jgi:hypothetical protein
VRVEDLARAQQLLHPDASSTAVVKELLPAGHGHLAPARQAILFIGAPSRSCRKEAAAQRLLLLLK